MRAILKKQKSGEVAPDSPGTALPPFWHNNQLHKKCIYISTRFPEPISHHNLLTFMMSVINDRIPGFIERPSRFVNLRDVCYLENVFPDLEPDLIARIFHSISSLRIGLIRRTRILS